MCSYQAEEEGGKIQTVVGSIGIIQILVGENDKRSVLCKEQGRLNQATCTTLLATLEVHKATCDAAEMNLMKKLKDKEDLKALLHPYLEEVKKKYRSGNGGNNDSLKLIEMGTDNLSDSDLDLPAISPIADVKPLANEVDDVVKENEVDDASKKAQNLKSHTLSKLKIQSKYQAIQTH